MPDMMADAEPADLLKTDGSKHAAPLPRRASGATYWQVYFLPFSAFTAVSVWLTWSDASRLS